MAKRTVNIGSTANDGTGDQLRTAFDKLNQNNDEIYGPDFVTEDMLNDNIVGADELKVTGNGAAGQILTSNADGTFSWATGVTGDITGVEAGEGLTGGGTGGDVILNVAAGTGITVAADSVSLATTVQDEISLNTLKNGITTAQAGEIADNTLKVGITTAQAGEIVVNNGKFTNADHTGDVTGDGALTIADDVVTAAKLDVSNAGADGQVLQYNADGTMTWVTGVTGDVTGVAAGFGLTGGGTGGDLTLTVGAGDGITVAADTVSLAAGVAGDGLTLTTGVLSVDTIQTGDIADDAITSPKLALFVDDLAATDTHILIANGTDFDNKPMSGDATMANTGAITIANDAVTADKLANSINVDIAIGVAKVSNITTDLSITGTTDARTIVSSDGTDAIIPVATASVSGLMSKTIFDEHEVNNAKAAGTATNLTKTVSGTGFAINSSDGTNVDLSLADTDNWGLMSDEMFDAQVLNTAKLTNATHDGEVTGSGTLTIADGAVVTDRLATDAVTTVKILNANVTTAKIADANVTTDKILDDNVTHDKLENRYTAINAIGTTSGAFNIDFSLGAVHTATLGGAHTGTFINFKVGQVIDIIITGNHALTFSATASGTPAINKVGTTAYDGTATQIIQVQCASDDSTTPIFYYACNTYAVDTTP